MPYSDKHRRREYERAKFKRRMQRPEFREAFNAKRRARYAAQRAHLPKREKLPAEEIAKRQKERIKRRAMSIVGRAKIMREDLPLRHKQKGFTGDIVSLDWIIQKLKSGRCELSGLPFRFDQQKPAHAYAPSIDRIDNTRGYTEDNVRVVLWGVNIAMNVWGLDEYIAIAKSVIEQRRNSMDPK